MDADDVYQTGDLWWWRDGSLAYVIDSVEDGDTEDRVLLLDGAGSCPVELTEEAVKIGRVSIPRLRELLIEEVGRDE